MGFRMCEPQIHILMGTKNAGGFLSEQLDSFRGQTHRNWSLWASDDGSTDATWAKLIAFKENTPDHDIHLLKGPQRGVAENYFSMLRNNDLAGQWVALSDQDDVWLPQKLFRAVARLRYHEEISVYSCRSRYVDENMSPLGASQMLGRPCRFGNAIVQNVLRGNTIVIPPIVTDYLRSILHTTESAEIPFHDWWIYQAITAAGFDVIHDEQPGILYRQHDGNLLGSPGRHIGRRVACLTDGTFVKWVDANAAGMYRLVPVMTATARDQLLRFLDWRTQGNTGDRAALTSLDIYRQTHAGDLALHVLARWRRF
jgi:glycosyltransferase involved in cell wall biosynthesis